ncbi:GAF and ANTAR domain-containing protein [Mycolicibacterium sp. XJ870]
MTDADRTVSVRSAMADLAANFISGTDIDAILETVTTRAVELISDVDFAGVLLIDAHRYRSIAPTAAIATHLDNIQIELQEGPCLEAATDNPAILCPDLASETRWPDFAAAAVAAGVGAMMSFQLYSYTKLMNADRGRGALNLFSQSRCDFSVEDQAVGAMLATHAATALIAADRQTQFESALASRDILGQAKGILMERFKVDAVHAFDLLVRLSQDSNTPVRVVAQRIVDST